MKIKIAFFGNTCNNFFQFIKLLGNDDELDLHLYIDNKSDPQQLPENDDPELADNYPNWIHIGSYITPKTIIFPWLSPLVKEFDKYDLVVVSHFGPVFTTFSKTPSIFFPAGADLTVHPFAISYFNLYYHSLREKFGSLFMSFWQKKGIRRCNEVWVSQFKPYQMALERLKIPEKQIGEYIPVVYDLSKNSNKKIVLPEVKQLKIKYDFIIFYPTRIMLSENEKMRKTGNWKGNDVFMRAYKLFVDKNPKLRSILLLIDRPASKDVNIMRALITKLELNNKVTWLKPKNGFGFSRSELLGFYSIADVVPNEFAAGWFGSIVLEALSCGVNVVSFLDEEAMSKMYPWHPILSEKEPDKISLLLEKLCFDTAFKEENAKKGPLWVSKYHSGHRIREQLKKQLLNGNIKFNN
jgi:glycosyltransferase involved in cell wall biosynthesis